MSEKPLNDLLPEGLSEETLEEVSKFVEDTIEEQVEEKTKILEARVNAYLRMHIDMLKEQAVKELELENETFRNSRLFEALRTYMSIELSRDDEESAIQELVSENETSHEEVTVLTDELNKALAQNEKLDSTLTALSAKISVMEGEHEERAQEIEELKEASEKPFKSSEKAVVIANNVEQPKRTVSNEFLTEEVMKYMPFTNQGIEEDV